MLTTGRSSARLLGACGALLGCLLAAQARGAVADTLSVATGPAVGDNLGFAVAGVGDISGDGGPDIAIGLPRRNGVGASDRGEVHIWGTLTPLADPPDKVLAGEAAGDQFGWAVRPAGDVNGDGHDDLVVGAPFNDAGGANAGRAYVYFGGGSLPQSGLLVLTGEAAGDQFGYAVAGAGDVNADGYDDVIVGAPYNAAGGATAGRAYVFFGGPEPDSVPDAILTGPAGYALGWAVSAAGDLNGDGLADAAVGAILNRYAYVCFGDTLFDATPGLVLAGETASDRFGYSLASAGDFNGDGWDDLVVGAMHNDAGGFDAGRAYLYFGGPAVDAVADLVLTGQGYRVLFGRTVAGAGDVNADGYDDLVVGAPTPDTGGFGPGAAYVFFGGDPGGPHPPDDQPDLVLADGQDSARYGCQVAPAGDRDGDGRADFLVGANLYDADGLLDAGRAWLLRVPNQPPLAAADTLITDEDTPAALALLGNDSDPDGTLAAAGPALVLAPAHGVAQIDTLAGLLHYAPDADWHGADVLAYRVRDNEGAWSDTTLVTLLVGPVNDPPIVFADADTTVQGIPVLVAVLRNDSDPDGPLAAAGLAVVAPPSRGTAAADTLAGAILYTPAAGFAGADTFSYTVTDSGGATSDPALVTILVRDLAPPAAVAQLLATTGTGRVALAWSGVPADADSVELWRALWRDGEGRSAWPLYDDAPGFALPVRPGARAEAVVSDIWERVATLPATVTSHADTLLVPGVWSYEVFARDAAGNWGPPAPAGAWARDYRLGDLAPAFDGVVDTLDAARLAACYGTAAADSAFAAVCDIGPTDSGDETGTPLTDGAVDFEDLMIVALDFDTTVPPAGGDPGNDPVPLAWVRVDERTWSLRLDAPVPGLKGLHVAAALPESVTAAVAPGALLATQAGPVFLQNARAHELDTGLALLGHGLGLAGTGELFRVILSAACELPAPTIAARDVANAPLAAQIVRTTDAPPPATVVALAQNAPNPFNPATVIRFTLPAAARARLEIIALDGRRVAILVDGELAAGDHAATWTGRDARGAVVASGVYLYRLATSEATIVRRMTLIR